MPVEIPAAVHLTGQDLIGHVAHKPLVDTQARLIQRPVPGQCPLSVSNGPLEAAGALAADLRVWGEGNRGLRWAMVSLPQHPCSPGVLGLPHSPPQ